MTQLSFDFTLSVQTNMTNNLMVMHRDLHFLAQRLYDDQTFNRFNGARFDCRLLRNHLFQEGFISTSQWESFKEHYYYCVDLYEERLCSLNEVI